jgi:hypothetical protein
MAIVAVIQSKTTSHTRRRIVAPKESRTQMRLTIDSFYTLHYFNQLFAVFGIATKNALAEKIMTQFSSQEAESKLAIFYAGPWLEIPFQRIDTSIVFPLTTAIRDEIDRVGLYVLGGVNRSRTFRIMVNYLAHAHKIKKPIRVQQNY